jgi:WD40 repeat protein
MSVAACHIRFESSSETRQNLDGKRSWAPIISSLSIFSGRLHSGKLMVLDCSARLSPIHTRKRKAYLSEDKDLQLVQSAIRLSANVLARDARQLAGQLMGRLLGNKTPDIQVLLKQAAGGKAWPWFRPFKPSLTAPGGSLIRIHEGHTRPVHAVAVTRDGRHAVSGSMDKTLRVWDLATGETKTTLQGHTGWVNAVAVTPDDRHVVSGSSDKTLRVWDLKDGKEILTFTLDLDAAVTAYIVAQDNRTIVAGDQSGRLHFLRIVEADETKSPIGE